MTHHSAMNGRTWFLSVKLLMLRTKERLSLVALGCLRGRRQMKGGEPRLMLIS